MITPAMQQYYDIKKQHEDAIVFFRMWDFYEMFWDDAHIAHSVLGIAVTTRNKNAKNPEPLAGFPHHAKEKYLPLLVEAWYKVAIVEQVSDPKLKGIVKREVVRVVTPTTLSLESDNFDEKDIWDGIVCVCEKDWRYGLSLLYITTWDWKTTEFSSFELLASELHKLSPKEVILEKKLFQNTEIKEILQKKYSLHIYYYEGISGWMKYLLHHFQTKSLDGFWISHLPLAIESSALLLSYLEHNQKQSLHMLQHIWVYTMGNILEIDAATLRNLDILYNFSTQSEMLGTLYGILNKTQTSLWKRLLKQTLLRPSKDIVSIEKKQKFIEAFLSQKPLLDKIRDHLKQISDIDMIVNRIALQRMTPRDLLNLKTSLIALIEISKILSASDNTVLKQYF